MILSNLSNDKGTEFTQIKEIDMEITSEYLQFDYKKIFFSWQIEDQKVKCFTDKLYSMDKSINKLLYKAIKHEYGIDCTINLQQAYKFYLLCAYVEKNSFAFY